VGRGSGQDRSGVSSRTAPRVRERATRGFSATKDAYVDWLIGELDAIGEPVDLVGHDWGGIITVRVATAFGDRVRSWVTDAANIFHEQYEWHDFAKTWQTPGEGEAAMEALRGLPVDDGVAVLVGLGVPESGARAMWEAGDEKMDACILDLYRSAVPNAAHDWGSAVAPTKAPGLVLVASDDPFGNETLSRDMATAWARAANGSRVSGTGGRCRIPRVPPTCSRSSGRRSRDGGHQPGGRLAKSGVRFSAKAARAS
jgi:pimeloyl-ACP methyl ester carboxylesterase